MASSVFTHNLSTLRIIVDALGGIENVMDSQSLESSVLIELSSLAGVDKDTLEAFDCVNIDFPNLNSISFTTVEAPELFVTKLNGFKALHIPVK